MKGLIYLILFICDITTPLATLTQTDKSDILNYSQDKKLTRPQLHGCDLRHGLQHVTSNKIYRPIQRFA